MKKSIVLIGAGEMGGVFARGFLKAGYPVFPVTRGMVLADVEKEVSNPEAAVVAVAEKDLHSVLEILPKIWHDRVVLLQNELLPQDWRQHNLTNPTVISVWVEKKFPKDYKVLVPSPVYGPKAQLVNVALGALDIPTTILEREDDLLFELVLKNVYILTTNIAGLEVGGDVGVLWGKHQSFARDVVGDVMDIQFALTGKKLDREKLIDAMVAVFKADPEHKCMGRSAPARLKRALEQAGTAGLEVKTLRGILTKVV